MVNSKPAEEWNPEWGRFLKFDLAPGWKPQGTVGLNIPLRKKLSVKTWDFGSILSVKPVPKEKVMSLSGDLFLLFLEASWWLSWNRSILSIMLKSSSPLRPVLSLPHQPQTQTGSLLPTYLPTSCHLRPLPKHLHFKSLPLNYLSCQTIYFSRAGITFIKGMDKWMTKRELLTLYIHWHLLKIPGTSGKGFICISSTSFSQFVKLELGRHFLLKTANS